jgi:arylsulfatase A-like enzyme
MPSFFPPAMGACIGLLGILSMGLVHADEVRPNIVFFFVDDMGWQDTSVPFHTETTELNQRYRTPNMEALARGGMKFTQAYACTLCSPSRVSLMTGANAARHRVTNWTLRENQAYEGDHPSARPPLWNINGLSPVANAHRTFHATTLPMLLQQAGYHTIHAGKAHFGADNTPGEDPKDLGFDVNIAGHCAGGPGSYYGTNNFSAEFRQGDRIWDVPGLDQYHGQDINLNEVLTIEANKAIDTAVAGRKPFYLYMSHYAIHAPFEADHRFLSPYQQAGLNNDHATYASMIESMDKSLGDILENLKRHGVDDNTIVVFMSDNGAPSQAPRNWPLRGHKIDPYEGGSRVPLLVRWPGVVEQNSQCDQYVMIEDIFPTFLEMAAVSTAASSVRAADGVSFVPLLKQTADYPANRSIYWHFPHTYGNAPYSVIRKGDWKLIHWYADGRLELYNLAADIGEQHNLAAEQPEVTRRLASDLASFLREVDAQAPIAKGNGQPFPFADSVVN